MLKKIKLKLLKFLIKGNEEYLINFISNPAVIQRITTSQTFIRDIQSIEVNAEQLNIPHLRKKLLEKDVVKAEHIPGGINVKRPDGNILVKGVLNTNEIQQRLLNRRECLIEFFKEMGDYYESQSENTMEARKKLQEDIMSVDFDISQGICFKVFEEGILKEMEMKAYERPLERPNTN